MKRLLTKQTIKLWMLYILEGVSALSSFNKMSGCNKDTECPDSMRCVGRTCLNLCPSACGTNSVCRMTNHLPVCSCPPGYRGNPYAWVYNYERSRCDFVVDGVKRGLSSKSSVSCLSQAACPLVMITLFLGRAIHVIFSIFHFEPLKNIPPHKKPHRFSLSYYKLFSKASGWF